MKSEAGQREDQGIVVELTAGYDTDEVYLDIVSHARQQSEALANLLEIVFKIACCLRKGTRPQDAVPARAQLRNVFPKLLSRLSLLHHRRVGSAELSVSLRSEGC